MPPEYVTADDVMARLRLPDGHPDAAYVAECTTAANELVDNYLDRHETEVPYVNEKGHRDGTIVVGAPPLVPPYPRSVWRAALGVAIRIYRFKDAESDVSDTWNDTGALRIPRDPLAGYRDMLNPWRPGLAFAPT